MTHAIAIVGLGKIAQDQHLPTLAASDTLHLAGVVSGHAKDLDVPVARTITELKAAVPDLVAVSLCTPPMARTALIEEALSLGLDIMVEKPPAASVSVGERYAAMAREAGRALYLTWHSREASGVGPAAEWLSARTLRRVSIAWKEDVRVWHPGQEWIWEPGIGVFDPGVNALSILTRLVPGTELHAATLKYPSDREAPIMADLTMARGETEIAAEFSFDQRGPQTWTMTLETDDGTAELREGGGRLFLDGAEVAVPEGTEYGRLYRRFAGMIGTGAIDADLSPFRLVADAFMLGRHERVGAFRWDD
ncbi:Gfo/Idh/MocA family protein [Sphingomonas sp. Y38-1Y]|uniref:Gfo/Idh/MocA family protein n=1 Tax=Sphingomonas sp. Y38-1Y TaxID=3078265 RepID=UPI0028F0ED5F|nr:Gfo/Idh/MocA family oxidoreductase [Sphingomonas sp. Y38-1Y]